MTATLLPPAQLAGRHAELMRGLVLARMQHRLEESGALLEEQSWLAAHAAGSEAEWSQRLDELELQAPMTPLGRLDRDDALLVTAAGLIEDDIRFGALFAALQAPLTSRRPCVGLLSWLLGRIRETITSWPGAASGWLGAAFSRCPTPQIRGRNGWSSCPSRSVS